MVEHEWIPPDIRGYSETSITRDDLVTLLADLVSIPFYSRLLVNPRHRPIDATYSNNEAFWDEAIYGRSFEGRWVRLAGFHLTEWIPYSPGRYFTNEAAQQRNGAIPYLDAGLNEYRPLGKGHMVFGGFGSVRLASKTRPHNAAYYVLGASSSGTSHEGIPVALPELEYRKVIRELRKYGGCYTNLTGKLQMLPLETPLLHYDREVPRFCLVVDDVEVIRPSSSSDLLVTVAIAFRNDSSPLESAPYRYMTDYMWSYCSFHPGSDDAGLGTAVDWLIDYVFRHFHMDSPVILSDFDEHFEHFNSPVQFPMSEVARGRINRKEAKVITEKCEINIENLLVRNQIGKFFARGSMTNRVKGDIVEGDQITLSGSFQGVNVKSTLTNVAQSISTLPMADQASKDQLVRLMTELDNLLKQVPVEMSADAELVSKRVATLIEETKKPDPDKALVEFSRNNLKTVATKIAQVLPPVLTIVTQIEEFIRNIMH